MRRAVLYLAYLMLFIQTVYGYNVSFEAQLYDSSGSLITSSNQLVNVTARNTTGSIVYTNIFNVTTDTNGRFSDYINLTQDYGELEIQFTIGSDNATNWSKVGYVPYAINSLFLNGSTLQQLTNRSTAWVLNTTTLNNQSGNLTINLTTVFSTANESGLIINWTPYTTGNCSGTDSCPEIFYKSGGTITGIAIFNNKALFNKEVYFYNTSYYTETSQLKVNNSLVLEDLLQNPRIILNATNTIAAWFGSPVNITNTLYVNLASCDTLDTNANGEIVCGTDLDTRHNLNLSVLDNASTFLGINKSWFDQRYTNDTDTWNTTNEMVNATQNYFVNLSGDAMTGPLNVTPIYLANVSLGVLGRNPDIDGVVYGVNMTNPPGSNLPHFVIQSGGPTQASYIMRSFMVVNEIPGFFTLVNRTSCAHYMRWNNETLQIDCNTTTTGADLLVSDDLQVVDEMWLKSRRDRWHFMSRDLDVLDHLWSRMVVSNYNINVSSDTLNITDTDSLPLGVNLEANATILDTVSQTLAINSGTNTSPVWNYVTYQNAQSPTLTLDSSYPSSVPHADVWHGLQGDTDNFYLWAQTGAPMDQFNYKVAHRFEDSGTEYSSGFSATVNTTDVNISSGAYWDGLMEIETDDPTTILIDGFYWVNSTGHFNFSYELSALTQYNDGTDFTTNAYVNVIFGVISEGANDVRLIAIPQNEPASPYTTAAAAEQDSSDTITYTSNSADLNKHIMPLIRVIFRNSNDELQQFDTGAYFRSVVGVAAAGAAAGGTNQHSLLDELTWSTAGHTFDTTVDFNGQDVGNINQLNATHWSNVTINTSQIRGLTNHTTDTRHGLNTSNKFLFNQSGQIQYNETRLNESLQNYTKITRSQNETHATITFSYS